MNGITILIWITIAIIAIIAIIIVKLHYRGEELAQDEQSLLNDIKPVNKVVNAGKSILSRNNDNSKSNHVQLNTSNSSNFENSTYDEPVIYEVENENSYRNIEYESQNQVLVDYGNTVEKFQEPIKQSQMDIMSQNNNPNNEKHELKDLFTIDELIKESKRKDSEREKETHSVKDEEEISELKESIKRRQENNVEESLIEEIITEDGDTISELINESQTDIADAIEEETVSVEDDATEKIESEAEDPETPIITSQDIKEVIDTASQEIEDEPDSISESSDITDVLLDNTEEETPKEEIKEPILKTPTKVSENKDIDEASEYENELDYRKDLAKITNTIKGSKLFQDVKERLVMSEPEPVEDPKLEEEFIRNVNEYEEEFEPIINETHSDFETYEEYHEHDHDFDEIIRQENTQRAFSIVRETPEKPVKQPKIETIKEKPSKNNIKIQLNNNEVVLKKGDEIIFNHLGETYSSQVYAINGDDISVKYRRQNITIKPSDVKKVY